MYKVELALYDIQINMLLNKEYSHEDDNDDFDYNSVPGRDPSV